MSLAALTNPAWLQSASAAVPACIADDDYGSMGIIEDPTDTTSNDIRGTRSNVWINDETVNCQFISSIYVFSPSRNGDMEFGYVIGYSNCNGNTYAHPTLFWWSFTNTGERDCGVWGGRHPTEGQYDTFRVSDTNANTYWGSYFNGEELQPNGVNLDFARGWSLAAMERGAASDTGHARYNELNEYHDSNGWTRWDDLTLDGDFDPNYHLNRINAYTGAFVH